MYDSTDGRSINYQIIPLLTMESASPDLPKVVKVISDHLQVIV